MQEPGSTTEGAGAKTEKAAQIQSIADALRSIVGRLVIVSTPDSLQAVPLGYQIKPSYYKAKVLRVYDAMVVLAAEGSKKKTDAKPTTLKQYLPLTTVRRICVGKDEIHLHL